MARFFTMGVRKQFEESVARSSPRMRVSLLSKTVYSLVVKNKEGGDTGLYVMEARLDGLQLRYL